MSVPEVSRTQRFVDNMGLYCFDLVSSVSENDCSVSSKKATPTHPRSQHRSINWAALIWRWHKVLILGRWMPQLLAQ